MEMTLSETSIPARGETSATTPPERQTRVTIKTGNADCLAFFYPSLYQLSLFKAGTEEKIDLGFSGSRLLERLLQTPGEVIAREELMSHAWADRVVGQGSLNQQIYTLRQILGDEKEREIIQTLPRRGYMLNPKYIEATTSIGIADQAAVAAASPDLNPPLQNAVVSLASMNPPANEQQNTGNNLWRSRLSLLAGIGVLSLFGMLLVQKQTPATNLAGNLNLTYAPEQPGQMVQLVPLGETLGTRVKQLTDEPLQLVLGLHNDVLTLVCLHTDSGARSLHIPVDGVAQLTEADLAPCL